MPKTKPQWTAKSNRILEHATNLENYNRWLLTNFGRFLKGRTLEVGAGLGGLAKLLPKKELTVSDIRTDYFEYLKKNLGVKTILFDIEKEAPEKLRNKFDSILSANVFEHIEDDIAALEHTLALLKPGGHLLLFVPARPEIFGSLDKDMGHFRRYTKKELAKKARLAGYKISKIKYVNIPGYISWWARGLVKTSILDKYLAGVFDKLITPLLYLEKYLEPSFGQSLVLVARKPTKAK